MSFALFLDFLREARWFLPPSSGCSGIGLALALLLVVLACLVGCCCGACITLVLISEKLRRFLFWILAGCASNFLHPEPPIVSDSLRRRLSQYRSPSA